MTKTTFELVFEVSNISSVEILAQEKISDFLNISVEELSSYVDMEFKVKNGETSEFTVTVYANIKRSVNNLN